jgi:hypothetical protein
MNFGARILKLVAAYGTDQSVPFQNSGRERVFTVAAREFFAADKTQSI